MFIQTLFEDQRRFFAVVITVIVSITVHELAHGVVAIWLGDRTPIESGHMTPNPVVHLGLFSVIALLLAGIAWGSMPINPSRLRGRFGEALVALAGPVSNVLLAVLALTGLGLWLRHQPTSEGLSLAAENFRYLLLIFGFVNFNLALFNLIPLPPLDGSRILGSMSQGYGRFLDSLNASGAALTVFLIAFMFAGKVTGPLALKMMTFTLDTVVGEPS